MHMAYSAFDRSGGTVRSPSVKQMRQLLASLVPDGATEDCVSVVHDGQWSISAYYSGLVCFENPKAGEGPWHLTNLSVSRILELWQLLAEGNLEELRRLPWVAGDGS
jgi:hypothetical protein